MGFLCPILFRDFCARLPYLWNKVRKGYLARWYKWLTALVKRNGHLYPPRRILARSDHFLVTLWLCQGQHHDASFFRAPDDRGYTKVSGNTLKRQWGGVGHAFGSHPPARSQVAATPSCPRYAAAVKGIKPSCFDFGSTITLPVLSKASLLPHGHAPLQKIMQHQNKNIHPGWNIFSQHNLSTVVPLQPSHR